MSSGVPSANIVSLDYSSVVVERMREKHGDACGEWVVGDITQLDSCFPAESFDVAIEKFTIDALTVDPGDVWSMCRACCHATAVRSCGPKACRVHAVVCLLQTPMKPHAQPSPQS